MRWYKIQIGSLTFDATGDPNALNVEFDIPVAPETLPKTGAFVRVWGIDNDTLLNARNLNKQPVMIYGGMQRGLPLANPAQQGLLVQGTVFPALGNRIGTDRTLDINIAPPFGNSNPGQAANLVHNWINGQPLSAAIQQTLTTAFPKYTPKINISSNLKLSYTDSGFYQTLGQYASYIYSISRTVLGSTNGYQGVHITAHGTDIIVDDGTVASKVPKQIAFTDLIGQPIWTGINTVQFKAILRGDIKISDTVTLPKTAATLTLAGASAAGSNSNTIQGSFKIQTIRHTGNFRQADGLAWVTTFDGVQA